MIIKNKEFKEALAKLEENQNDLLLTGKAGTGKSTLLRHFVTKTKKKFVLLCPTGISALNIGGETIHSFFGFKPQNSIEDVKKIYNSTKEEKKSLIQNLELIIIDEISMVRADITDMMDLFLRIARKTEKPFGGIRMVFVGDLYQLPPILKKEEAEFFLEIYPSPYFFDSEVIRENINRLDFLELKTIFRQSDKDFKDILNKVRIAQTGENDLKTLNSRIIPKSEKLDLKKNIYICTTNAKANEINTENLTKLRSEEKIYTAVKNGLVENNAFPCEENLVLKKGAKVMFVANSQSGEYVNGTIGYVSKCEKDFLVIQTEDRKEILLKPCKWEYFTYKYDFDKKSIKKEITGTFEQFPLKLAWAITIHKSQGQSFSNIILDLGYGAFANGQTYVALSRCTSLEGIKLITPIKAKDIQVDEAVNKFLGVISNRDSDITQLKENLQNTIGQRCKLTYIDIKKNKVTETVRTEKFSSFIFEDKVIETLIFTSTDNLKKEVSLKRILGVQVF